MLSINDISVQVCRRIRAVIFCRNPNNALLKLSLKGLVVTRSKEPLVIRSGGSTLLAAIKPLNT
jgi:hypothetical protein